MHLVGRGASQARSAQPSAGRHCFQAVLHGWWRPGAPSWPTRPAPGEFSRSGRWGALGAADTVQHLVCCITTVIIVPQRGSGVPPRLLPAATAAAAARRFSRLLLYSVLQVVHADAKDIIFDNASRKKMQDGINKVADAVQVTLGPRGERFTRYGAEQSLLLSWPSFCLHCRVCCGRGCSRAAACATCAQSSQSEQPWIHRRRAALLEG